MSELDPMIRDYYEDETLDEGVMDRLLAMDATEAQPAPKGLPWWRYAAMAAGLLLVVGAVSMPASVFYLEGGDPEAMAKGDGLADAESVPFAQYDMKASGAEPTIQIIQGDRTTQELPIGRTDGDADVDVDRDEFDDATADPGPRPAFRRAARRGRPNDGVSNSSNAHPMVSPKAMAAESERQRRIAAQAREAKAQAQRAETAARAQAEQEAAARGAKRSSQEAERRRAVELQRLGYIANDGVAAVEGVAGGPRGLPDTKPDAKPQKPKATPTRVDAVSTFAVDVDTASWNRAASALERGFLPDANSVRVEEFVNAFHYDYEAPSEGPFAANIEVAPSLWDTDKHLVRIGLQGKRVSVFDRKPVHLTLLVDVSGSMQGADRLPLLKVGLSQMVNALRDGDTVALVTYAGNTRIALEPTSIQNKAVILEAIQSLSSSGGTAMGAGIDLAYGLAMKTHEPGAINRVMIASDGDANVGASTPTALLEKVRAAADKGITLTTLGFGHGNYRDDVMETLANKGDGAYTWIGSEYDAKKVLVDDLTGTLEVIARDVKVQVAFDPDEVTTWRQIGYENRQLADRDFRNDTVDAGEVGAGHQVTALYEVTLGHPKAKVTLGELRVRYERPGANGSRAAERRMPLTTTPHPSLGGASEDMRVATVAAGFAESLRGKASVPMGTLDDLLPHRPEYAEQDERLRQAIQKAAQLGL